MEKQWEELSADEKQEAMFNSWLSQQGIEFASPEAEKLYRERVTRLKDAIQLKKVPDRVPIFTIVNFFPAYYAGLTPKDMMYDYEKLTTAVKKYVLDFEPDANPGGFFAGSAKIFEILDVKLYAWPGHGVAPEHTYQCLEGEYMMADEYDALIQDPTGFFIHVYMPRVFGALGGFPMLPFFPGILEIYGLPLFFIPFGFPPVQATYQALFEAGGEALQ